MKTLGLLGGMSWESTQLYYRLINQGIQQQLGGLHSAKILLHSVDFAEIETLQRQGDWQQAAKQLAKAAQGLEQAGAQGLLICTNTMHLVAEIIQDRINMPLLHIADATAKALQADQMAKVALLGTRFTMEKPFYRERLVQKGLEVLIPSPDERREIDHIIFTELCRGHISETSRMLYQKAISALQQQGAQAVILGCTEIGMLIQQSHANIPLYDTTELHAQAGVRFALNGHNAALSRVQDQPSNA